MYARELKPGMETSTPSVRSSSTLGLGSSLDRVSAVNWEVVLLKFERNLRFNIF
jgi:hypothetical protein